MALKPSIVISHSDETLLAEIAFWAASAEYDVTARSGRKAILEACGDDNTAAVILELSNQGEEVLDTLEEVSRAVRGKVIAICPLDSKTTSSIRRLCEAKALNAIILAREEFSTRLLADLLKADILSTHLDRETLAQAIRDGHVVAYYQPKVPFQPGEEKYGVEALCRIQHPKLGMLLPDSFISLAEARGLILELTDAVTVHAFRSLAGWDAAGMRLRLALNISPRLISDTAWFDLFQRRCQEFDIDPSRITLEVTESSSQGQKVLALEILSRLRLKGFLLSIDDFGTGFSSLETLYKLPFGELKIDKGFVFDLHKNSEARALIESTIMLARRIGLRICAEGVESEALFNELRDMKCDDAQGYYVSEPLPAEEIVPFFQDWIARRADQGGSSKFAALHALLADLIAPPEDEGDETIVLSSAPASQPDAQTDGRAIAGGIPALVLAGEFLSALEQVHRAIAAEGDGGFRAKLEKLRTELEQTLKCENAVGIVFAGRPLQLLAASSVTIGRQSPSARADIAIVCPWLSRGEKNLRLFLKDGRWMAEDLGSTNGHFIEAKRLAPNVPTALPPGETLIEIGRSGHGPAPAWLLIKTAPGAALVTFGRSQDGEPTEADESGDWIVLDREFSIGAAPEALLTHPACRADIIADVSLRDGDFWIAPRGGETIAVSGVEFSQGLPLPSGADLTLENSSDVTRLAPRAPASRLPAAAHG